MAEKKAQTAKKEKNPNKGFVHGVKEIVRKFIVALKRRPQRIPLVAFVIAFIYYSFNLTVISQTTYDINKPWMGLCEFVTMLLSMLGILCCMNAFPYRKKPVIPMVALTFGMSGIVIAADIIYSNIIIARINTEADIYAYLSRYPHFITANNMLQTHIVLMIISIALTALLPLYSKLIRKIKTSVEVEGNGDMKAIDLSAE